MFEKCMACVVYNLVMAKLKGKELVKIVIKFQVCHISIHNELCVAIWPSCVLPPI